MLVWFLCGGFVLMRNFSMIFKGLKSGGLGSRCVFMKLLKIVRSCCCTWCRFQSVCFCINISNLCCFEHKKFGFDFKFGVCLCVIPSLSLSLSRSLSPSFFSFFTLCFDFVCNFHSFHFLLGCDDFFFPLCLFLTSSIAVSHLVYQPLFDSIDAHQSKLSSKYRLVTRFVDVKFN